MGTSVGAGGIRVPGEVCGVVGSGREASKGVRGPIAVPATRGALRQVRRTPCGVIDDVVLDDGCSERYNGLMGSSHGILSRRPERNCWEVESTVQAMVGLQLNMCCVLAA